MKALIVTVAGLSSRFSKSLGYECLKCIYHQKDFKQSLIYEALHRDDSFDKIIIVGGYKFEELKSAINAHFAELKDKIVLVYNEKYAEYGSGYSLYKGLESAIAHGCDSAVFAEGDLFVDRQSFIEVSESDKSVITINREPIFSDKAVALYIDSEDKIKYIYDVNHKYLQINGSFKAVLNSGQIWKLANGERLRRTFNALTAEDWQSTNLVFVQKYFGDMSAEEYEVVCFKKWVNCNTAEDFNRAKEQ